MCCVFDYSKSRKIKKFDFLILGMGMGIAYEPEIDISMCMPKELGNYQTC